MALREVSMSSIYTVNTHLGALPSTGTIYVNDVQMGAQPGRVVTLEQYSKVAAVVWGSDVWDWSYNSSTWWIWAIWKITITDSISNGVLRVYTHGVSGSTPIIKLMRATTLDATATPDLTGDTTGPGGSSTCVKQTLNGSGAFTYQTGYFAIVTKGHGDPEAYAGEITKMEWIVDGTTVYPLYTQTHIGTSGVRLN